MKAIQLMKKWILISMLFVGISLTVYAIVPQEVYMEQISIVEVGTSYVDVCVTHWNAEHLIFELTEFETGNVRTYVFDTPYDPGSSLHRLDGLTPDTIYNVKVTAVGFNHDRHQLYFQVVTGMAP